MDLNSRKVGILVAPGFDDLQVVRLVDILRSRKASVIIIGDGNLEPAAIAGMRGSLLKTNLALANIFANSLDAVIIPGGNSTALLQANSRALTLLMEMHSKEKPIGAIGSGCAVLASAGLVRGKRVTGDPRVRMAMEESGAIFRSQSIVVDRNLVTSQSENNLIHFVDAISFLLEPATSVR